MAQRQRQRQDAQEEVREEADAQRVAVLHEAALVGEQRARVHAVLQSVGHAAQRGQLVGHAGEAHRQDHGRFAPLARECFDRGQPTQPLEERVARTAAQLGALGRR